MTEFYLGTHHPNWLGLLDVPLFVSRRRLVGRKSFPRAKCRWGLDSGAFTELSMHGGWTMTSSEYAADVRHFEAEIGSLAFAAPMDFMCEPEILAKTGLSVAVHQERTIDNFLDLAGRGLPVIPVLQGWTLGDYLDHAEAYATRGVDLENRLVGVGTICRRQAGEEAAQILRVLGGDVGLRLHAFGIKATGLRRAADAISSADSMAWSYNARRHPPMNGCVGHKNCANCPRYALVWREKLLSSVEGFNVRA